MTKKERIIKNVKADKRMMKAVKDNLQHWKTEDQMLVDLYNNGTRYIKAIKEGRVICSIGSVSSSGMSRTIKFLECSKGNNKYYYLNFFLLFKLLGYSEVKKQGHYFRINGCGMDMVFNTNHNNIHRLKDLGFITVKECETLAQQTPNVI